MTTRSVSNPTGSQVYDSVADFLEEHKESFTAKSQSEKKWFVVNTDVDCINSLVGSWVGEPKSLPSSERVVNSTPSCLIRFDQSKGELEVAHIQSGFTDDFDGKPTYYLCRVSCRTDFARESHAHLKSITFNARLLDSDEYQELKAILYPQQLALEERLWGSPLV